MLTLFDDGAIQLLLRSLTGDGLARGAVFVLVAARLAGFFCVGPILGRVVLPWPVRIGLAVLLTLIVAPGLPSVAPAPLRQISHDDRPASLSDGATFEGTRPWSRPEGFIAAVVCETALGAALGLAVAIFLSGLKLAGESIDRHSGLGLGSLLNPEYSAGGSAPADLAALLCVALILLMPPVGGHLLAVRCVLDTFHAIPAGAAGWPDSIWQLASAVVQQSLVLGLRIAIPFVVAMSLLDMTLGWFRRSSHIDLAPAAQAFRAGTALLVLAATAPGMQDAVSTSLQEALTTTRETLALDQ